MLSNKQLDIQGKPKPLERRLATLKKHLEQADIYLKYKGKKPLTESEQILFTTARDYLKGVRKGKTALSIKTWKTENARLTAERKTLNQRYLALKEEGKEARKIRKSVTVSWGKNRERNSHENHFSTPYYHGIGQSVVQVFLSYCTSQKSESA